MSKAVFTTKINPRYNDLPELMYHFSKTYLRQANTSIGDWIVYYEPRRTAIIFCNCSCHFIKPVRFKGPYSVRNGIALCRTLHLMFDHGLVSISDTGEIMMKKIVPDKIRQALNNDEKIMLPSNHFSAPHPVFLKFHREKIFDSTIY